MISYSKETQTPTTHTPPPTLLDPRRRRTSSLTSSKVEFVSSASQDADATVIIPSQQESTIVGKISRRGSLVRFPKPKELLETMTVETQQKLVRGAATSSSLTNSNPAQSSRPSVVGFVAVVEESSGVGFHCCGA
ncbi:hypothetical protein HID58_084851 [Brassica napus]|uniref:Uncharacterized protein n=1 Tax=Brassica napus TaxID=3708 RepID=A0ABQ7XNN6_BRANA|nr:hypothetical protein HID58_084851 [Brassica napus]